MRQRDTRNGKPDSRKLAHSPSKQHNAGMNVDNKIDQADISSRVNAVGRLSICQAKGRETLRKEKETNSPDRIIW